MLPNYFAPAFEIKINGSGLSAEVSKNIMNIQVTSAPDTMDHFSMAIANSYPGMRWTHTSDADLFKEGNAVSIKMGYVDNLHPMFDGEITSISPTFPESGIPTVTIRGYSRLHRLKGSPKIRTFKDVTDKEIVETIARDREVNLTPRAEATKMRHAYVMQGSQTNLAFLSERAKRIGFELMVDGKSLIFRKRKIEQSKTYTLVWGQPQKSFDPGAKILPLTGFTSTMNTLCQVNEVIVRGYDPKTKEKIESRAISSKQSVAITEVDAFGRHKEELIVENPIASQEEADQLARAIFNDRALEVLTGSGSCIGLPVLRAGHIIELLGLGPRFSGLYYVTQATHRISDNGYQTTFNVKQKAL